MTFEPSCGVRDIELPPGTHQQIWAKIQGMMRTRFGQDAGMAATYVMTKDYPWYEFTLLYRAHAPHICELHIVGDRRAR